MGKKSCGHEEAALMVIMRRALNCLADHQSIA
jgi:hypothetical protein